MSEHTEEELREETAVAVAEPEEGARTDLPPAPSAPGGFLARVASGLIYVVVFIGCIMFGTIPTALLVSVMSGLCCHEFFQMTKRDGKVTNDSLGLAAAVLFPLAALGDGVLLSALLFILILSVGLWYVYSPRTRIADVAVTLMGPLYTGFMLSAIVLLRDAIPGLPGAVLTVGVCASLWVSDSFAYLVGRAIGRHKMAPRISPKKTWEGFAGGVVGAVIVWLILLATGMFRFDAVFAVFCGVVVAVLGVFGDLIESRIKRGVGVKDSGSLMPGHGGMLDRCDSLIFGCITAELLLSIGGIL
ncbi:phosphatidate cytidylyltransferase [Enorma burkinafasonensis]|uniref:phosphatidate cytidylyltransferase n=1 Tax=Enorma burkinafasonensis TaxID=2590867 RepID=UPI0011A370B6|nr:phosphatidate cytidylyltransferase [Enorma burkinafasonensis]